MLLLTHRLGRAGFLSVGANDFYQKTVWKASHRDTVSSGKGLVYVTDGAGLETFDKGTCKSAG